MPSGWSHACAQSRAELHGPRDGRTGHGGSVFDLDEFLAARIPITQAMGITLAKYDDDELTLFAPLGPNKNDKGTAFAGALSTLVTLAGWSYTQVSLEHNGFEAVAMVAESVTSYRRPASADLWATCRGPDRETRRRFFEQLAANGKARWKIEGEVWSRDVMAVHYTADYVAIAKGRKDPLLYEPDMEPMTT